MSNEKIVDLPCNTCGGGNRKHDILYNKHDKWSDDESGEQGFTKHQVAQCRGCETVRFALITWDTLRSHSEEETVVVFPDSGLPQKRPGALDFIDLPEKVAQMYRETLRAFDAEAYTLCGVGLRAIVEALCLEQGVTAGNLQSKIDALVARGHLAAKQAEHLHEERYLGNAAVHEMVKPSSSDLEDGLQIIEVLLKTIYILPQHASDMKRRREARSAKKSPSAAKSANKKTTEKGAD